MTRSGSPADKANRRRHYHHVPVIQPLALSCHRLRGAQHYVIDDATSPTRLQITQYGITDRQQTKQPAYRLRLPLDGKWKYTALVSLRRIERNASKTDAGTADFCVGGYFHQRRST